MAYTVDVQGTQRYPADFIRAVAAAANEAMTHQQVSEGAALTILLTDDDYIQELNRQFRDEDRPTDVLSFPAGEPMPGNESLLEYLGDIAIAVLVAERQATEKGHPLVAELQLLAVHGVLHLVGYDHLESDEKEKMWGVQRTILMHLGLDNIQPTEDDHDD